MSDAFRKLGRSIRRARLGRGVPASDFACDLGISLADLADIEAGRARPSAAALLGMILTYDRIPQELYLVAAEDEEIARLVASLPRLRWIYRNARSHGRGPAPTCAAALAAASTARVEVSKGAIRVSWDVDRVDPDSLRAAKEALAAKRHAGHSVTLKFRKLGWALERYDDAAQALRRLERIDSFRGVPLLPATRIHRRPLSHIARTAALLQLAHAAHRGRDWFRDLREGPLAAYGLFFARDRHGDSLTFSQVGPRSECARLLGGSWRGRAIGMACDRAFADRRFDERISQSYETALARGEALLEHVVALIDLGERRVWVPYQRLLLPAGEELACFAAVTQHLDCPLVAQ